LWTAELRHHILWYVVASIKDEHAASIFMVQIICSRRKHYDFWPYGVKLL